MQSYTFCSHDWSFLESSCNSSTTTSSGKRPLPLVRTLKAGRHDFPFTFSLIGNLPSTVTTHPLNLNMSALPTTARASITYKLRAVASRPGLSLGPGPLHNVHITPMMLHNLTCTMSVYVLRSLSPEALEYQLSLEVENTWPMKLMYSIMLPHRAWAAGDTLVAVLKLCPLAKGVWVESVVTTLWETTQLHIQQHHRLKNALPLQGDKSTAVHNVTRIVRCVKHKILNGKAVRVDLVDLASAKSSRGSDTPASSASRPGSSDHSSFDARSSIDDTITPGPALVEEENRLTDEDFENHDVVTYITFPIPHLAAGPYSSTQATPTSVPPSAVTPDSTASAPTSAPDDSPPLGFSSYSYSPTPLLAPAGSSTTPLFSQSSSATINPTHNLPPIVVSHRIRWSFSIHNRDGHTSELRCSLPVHILDGRVLCEAREASVLTRRMALAAEGLWRGEEDEGDLGLGGGGMSAGGALNESGDLFVDRELPSYMGHVRDRVANMYYPEMATVRVPRIDIAAGGDRLETENVDWDDGDVEGGFAQPHSQSCPSPHSPHFQRSSRSASGQISPGHLPDRPHQHHHLAGTSSAFSGPPLDWVNSELISPSLSNLDRTQNTLQSTDSPQTHSDVHSQSGSSETNPGGSSGLSTSSDEHAQRTRGGPSVRNLSSLLKATMKPFAALRHQGNGGHGLLCFSKSSLPQDDVYDAPLSSPSSRCPLRTRRASTPPTLPFTTSSATTSMSSSSEFNASSIVHHSISEVPNYFIASQGFMGGVPPLSSLMGLPSYEEAASEDHRQRQAADHNAEQRSSPTSGNDCSTDPSGRFVSGPSLNVDSGVT